MAWLIPLALLLMLGALIAWRLLVGRREPGYLAICEYWVYTDQIKLPDQTALMERMISTNPHNRPGRPSIGAREGMLFTDVRLHLGVALKEKNFTAFRPDLFEEGLEPSAEALARLSEVKALVKVRFASEARLNDFRHLQFVPHMASAVSDLMNGLLVFDHVMEQMWTSEEFGALLQQNNNAERPDFHVRVAWVEESEGCFARTFGMRKMGRRELRSQWQDRDQEILITGLMMRLAHHLVRKPDDAGPYEFEDFGDTFTAEIEGREGKFDLVRLTRKLAQ